MKKSVKTKENKEVVLTEQARSKVSQLDVPSMSLNSAIRAAAAIYEN